MIQRSYIVVEVYLCGPLIFLQLSSCFLVCMKDDSIEGIYDTLKECAVISKSAGGIGVSVHNIRATGSYIRGTNGTSNGIIPMLRVFNDTARYVDQGGGKRKGTFNTNKGINMCVYLVGGWVLFVMPEVYLTVDYCDACRCFCCVLGALAC